MEKTPAGGDLAGVLYARITARALGSGGLESARHLVTLSPTLFCGCIKQLTLNRSWISGITLHSGRVGPQRERQARARPFSQRFALQRNGQRTLKLKGPAYCRAFLHSVIIDDGS